MNTNPPTPETPRSEWLRSLRHGEEIDIKYSLAPEDLVRFVVKKTDGDWILVRLAGAEDSSENWYHACQVTGYTRLGGQLLPTGGQSYLQALEARSITSDFLFSRYLLTGVNPRQYGSLRSAQQAAPFTFEGCLDAPLMIPGGSHESSGYRTGSSTSLCVRVP